MANDELDPKGIAYKGLDVVGGLGGAVVGVAGGGDAGAKGFQFGIGAVKDLVNMATGEKPEASRVKDFDAPTFAPKAPKEPASTDDQESEKDKESEDDKEAPDDQGSEDDQESEGNAASEDPIVPMRRMPSGATLEDIEYWSRMLRRDDLHEALRPVYLLNLRAAVEAVATDSVTAEDISFYIHAFRSPGIPDEKREMYRERILSGLRFLGILSES